MDLLCREPEKTVISKAVVKGCRQRFKPNVTRVSGMKEEPEKDAGNDKMSHPEPKQETEKVFNRVKQLERMCWLKSCWMQCYLFLFSFFPPEYYQESA